MQRCVVEPLNTKLNLKANLTTNVRQLIETNATVNWEINRVELIDRPKLYIPNYIITRNDRLRRQGGSVAILVRDNIIFGIVDTCSSIDTYNKVITVILKDSQYPTICWLDTTTYIPPASNINTTLLNNTKNSVVI